MKWANSQTDCGLLLTLLYSQAIYRDGHTRELTERKQTWITHADIHYSRASGTLKTKAASTLIRGRGGGGVIPSIKRRPSSFIHNIKEAPARLIEGSTTRKMKLQNSGFNLLDLLRETRIAEGANREVGIIKSEDCRARLTVFVGP